MGIKAKIYLGSFLSLFFNVFGVFFYIYSLIKEKEEINKKVLKKILDFHISFLLYPILFFPFAFTNLLTGDSSIFDLFFLGFIFIYIVNFLRYIVYFIKNKDTEESKSTFLNKNFLSLDIFNLKNRIVSEENKKEIKRVSKLYYFFNLLSFWIIWNIYFLIKYYKNEKIDNIELKDYYKNVLNTNLTYFISIIFLFIILILSWNEVAITLLGWIITILTFLFFVYYLKNFILNSFHGVYYYNKFNFNFSRFKLILIPSFLLLMSFLSFYFIINPLSNYSKFISYENKIKTGELKVFEKSLIFPQSNSKEQSNDFWYQMKESFYKSEFGKKVKNQEEWIKEIEDILSKYKWNYLDKTLKMGWEYSIKEITKEEENKIKENELFIKEGLKELGINSKELLKKDYKYLFDLANVYPEYSNFMIGYVFYLIETNQIEKDQVEIVYNYCSLGKEMTEKEFGYISYLTAKVFVRDCYVALYELDKVKKIKLDENIKKEYENLKNNFFTAETEAKYVAQDRLQIFKNFTEIDKESIEYGELVKFVMKISGVGLKSIRDYERLNNIKTAEDLFKFEKDEEDWQNSKFLNYFIPSYWIEKMVFVNFSLENSYKKTNEKLLNLKIID